MRDIVSIAGKADGSEDGFVLPVFVYRGLSASYRIPQACHAVVELCMAKDLDPEAHARLHRWYKHSKTILAYEVVPSDLKKVQMEKDARRWGEPDCGGMITAVCWVPMAREELRKRLESLGIVEMKLA